MQVLKKTEEINKNFPNVRTIVKNINTKNTNVILGQENINIYGDGFIEDILGEYTFKISPLSFYQVNPVQAEKLYNIGVEAAKITKNDIVFDLYCGIGTISLFMAKYAKKVYGVEIVEQAIQDAKENAKLNNIINSNNNRTFLSYRAHLSNIGWVDYLIENSDVGCCDINTKSRCNHIEAINISSSKLIISCLLKLSNEDTTSGTSILELSKNEVTKLRGADATSSTTLSFCLNPIVLTSKSFFIQSPLSK